jgi:Tetrapyrrole (Corrin/Porphyrin) Methylases
MKRGSLFVVGTGFRVATQTTPEALVHMKSADKLFYLAADVVTETWLSRLNPTAESLRDLYAPGRARKQTYNEIVRRVLAPVRNDLKVCVAFYGHPGLCAQSTHEAIRQARKEGFKAKMLPAISAEDCLFADLGIDPSDGCQIYEATSFLLRKPRTDPSCGLILLQAGAIGVSTYKSGELWSVEGLEVLAQELASRYSPRHKVIVYTAPHFPVCDPLIRRTSIARLPKAGVTIASTLYVPPSVEPKWDAKMAARIGLNS